ncbi:hypothetical protein NNO07_11050 [Pseudomonas resinovorans]|uniref:Uncharacterized protein n=1 Tax=Metapseudomonas resinovorans TaxID=53412 RepID=A0ABT4Y4U2_METRE|nr:hypothetical protein [Pseudomonas resinovorans]MDA8483610.1 hypothetical protein [Pseudomonas resinovorans]
MTTSAHHPLRSPRDYAAAILAEPMREERNRLLERCPEEWRDRVKDYVETSFQKLKAYREYIQGRRRLAEQKPPAAPRREEKHDIVNHPRSAPEVGNARLAELRALVGGFRGQ